MKTTPQKNSNNPSGAPKSQDIAINVIMETIPMTDDSHTDKTEPVHEAANENDLLSLFDQYFNLMSPTMD